MKNQLAQTIVALGAVALVGSASAETNLLSGGDIRVAAGWDNGLPSVGNPGTVTVDGIFAGSVFGYGARVVIDQTAGDLVGTGTNGFNINTGVTWNMTGGSISARYILSNGTSTIFNLSGGLLQLVDVAGTQHMGVANGGTVNISGPVVMDGTHATVEVQTGGAIDIASSWTGSWTWGPYSGTEWRDHFVNAQITFDGAVIDGTTFDATFVVSDGGQTLSMGAPVLPTDFNGGDMLAAGDWTNGLPVTPIPGTSAADGTFDDGNAGVADWLLTMTGGTITAGQDWNFTGASKILMQGGTLDVAGDILSADDSVMTFNDGTVSWGGSFEPAGNPGGTITINGGTFTGTTTAATSFGNVTGGILTVSGGSITASSFDFDFDADTSTIGGGAVLSGDAATFGYLDIRNDWTGSFTVTSFTGTDWETEFTSGNVSLGGADLDAAGFASNFTVSNGGQTLAYTPSTELLAGGNINNAADWSNGLPNAMSPGTIAVDGTIGTTVFGFGAGSVVDMSAGTLTAADGFNTLQGGTWNISGGKIITRYFLANGANSIINLRGGTIELADVEGNQDIGVANGGTLNISGPAVLDAIQASKELPAVGTIDINSDWSGSWTWGVHSGSDWENLFVAGSITIDGEVIDGTAFDSMFVVSDDGQTLALAGEPVLLTITPNGPDFDFSWESTAGKLYDLLSATDLTMAPVNWPVYDGRINIPADASGTTTVTNVPPGGPERFFVVLEKDPPPLLDENFDDGPGLPAGWTSYGTGNGTEWQVGTPSGANSPAAAHSPPNCAGTNISGDYTASADVTMASPAIAIPAGSGATLSFRQYIDTDLVGDIGSVRILDADNADTPIPGLNITPIEGVTLGWSSESLTLPVVDVGGKNIKIAFQFVSDSNTDVFGGFYVDDVKVKAVAP